MHEVGLMQEALEIALEQARGQGARQIHEIRMRVGALAGAAPDALRFAFDVVAGGTMAEGARFDIETVPLVCYCAPCGAEFQAEDLFGECPRCGRPSAEVRRGRELELVSLEVS